MQATKQREVQSQEERYVIECMSSCEAYTCAVACDSQRVRSLFVWSIEPLCGDKGLHSLDALSRTVLHLLTAQYVYTYYMKDIYLRLNYLSAMRNILKWRVESWYLSDRGETATSLSLPVAASC